MKEKLLLIVVMFIFGSIGLFVKNIDLSASEVALLRGLIGSIVLLLASFLLKQKIRLKTNCQTRILLFLSGGALGFNWIFLFEAYHHTTVSNATISYYFAPVIVMILSPFVLKENWAWYKAVSVFAALIGLVFIMNPGDGMLLDWSSHGIGIGYGLLAASLYASVILLNQFIKDIPGFDRTVLQLSIATVIMLPYVWITENMNVFSLDTKSIILLLIVGIVHTGLAYIIYFSILPKLSGQTVAVYSYLDPILAVLMATLILQEPLGFREITGGMLILGATLFHEVKDWRKTVRSEIQQ